MPRFSANLTFLFQEYAFLDRLAVAREQGFDAVEFMYQPDQSPAAIAAALRDNGLELVLMNTPAGNFEAGERGLACLPQQRQAFRTSIHRAFEVASAAGCKRLHVMAGVEPAGADRRALEACFLDNLAWAAEQAARAGLTLLLEPINRRDIPGYFLHDYDVAERILREMALPHLRLQFDMYHVQVVHGDVSKRLERQLPLIEHIQIANPPDRREPGNGELDYGFLLGRLDQLGYAGWVGCEYRPAGDTLDSLGWIRPWGVTPRR
ncbi:hydroxypyruvate isomerase family protein [Ferrovibrio sp.]|uniref:hydroxypyruvate isomerase family protein n=1 Tax=Ferrovibrio sp. TaxID=1917215 RepID=UPI003D145CFE